ncbi:hypothetical protein EJB05_04524, partial [Eragrostis curvula]
MCRLGFLQSDSDPPELFGCNPGSLPRPPNCRKKSRHRCLLKDGSKLFYLQCMITDVNYDDISGSSTTAVAIRLDCSASQPCSGIKLNDIRLTYRGKPATISFCNNVHGSWSGVVNPPN